MTDSNPATPYLAAAANAELEDWGPLEEATGEEMTTSGLTLWQDGDQEAGVWECTPGPVVLEARDPRVRPDPGWPDDGHPGRRIAHRHRTWRHRGVPARLGRHLADPREDPQGLRALRVATKLATGRPLLFLRQRGAPVAS